MTTITHIAGNQVTINGQLLRQRCAWCGTVLVDYDLTMIAVPAGQDPTPGTRAVGGLVTVDGGASWTVDLGPEGQLPEDCCTRLDPAVTV